MREGKSLAIAALAWSVGVSVAADETADGWKLARPGYEWSFPADHGAHPAYRTEWWYLTGHLESVDDPSRRFGYQFTIFRYGILPESRAPELASDWGAHALIMGHAAVSDLGAGRHRFAEVVHRASELLGGFTTARELGEAAAASPEASRRLAWCLPPPGTTEEWSIAWNGSAFDFRAADQNEGFSFRLATTAKKPLVLHGPGGYSRKDDASESASLYYSFTRLATEGVLVVDGEEVRVRGESWMDKEMGSNQLSAGQEGWDWFCLQLAGDEELMLYQLRDKDGRPDYRWGTVIGRSGEPRYLRDGEWDLEEIGSWRSPETGAEYPSGWRISLPALEIVLEVEPAFADQENVATRSAGLFYWEGAVRVRDEGGSPRGRGYVELTGYGDGGTPGI